MAEWVWTSAGLSSLTVLLSAYASVLVLRAKKRSDRRQMVEAKARAYMTGLEQRVHAVAPPALAQEKRKRIVELSIADLHQAIETREFSCVEVVSAYIAQVQEHAMELNAISDERLLAALKDAADLDASLKNGAIPSLLFGVPFSIKDNISHHDYCTSLGLARLCYNRLSCDSLIITALQKQGAIPLVRGTMAQLGASSSTVNCLTGITENPLRKGRSAGGSSGGEAALVSSHCVLFGLGGDIGGSVRTPAAFTGLVALRTTSARVSASGPVPKGGWPGFASSWGPLARTVSDLEIIMETLASEAVYRQDPLIPPVPWKRCGNDKLKVGFVRDDDFAPLCAAAKRAVSEAVGVLTSEGHDLCEFHIPDMRSSFSLFIRFFLSTVSALEPNFEWESSLPTVRQAILSRRTPEPIRKLLHWWYCEEESPLPSAPFSLVADYPSIFADLSTELQICRRNFTAAWREANIDVLIVPFPVPAGPHGFQLDICRALSWTALFNLVDFPAGVMPVTAVREDECTYVGPSAEETKALCEILQGAAGLPMGVQVVSRPYRDEACVAVMRQLERRLR